MVKCGTRGKSDIGEKHLILGGEEKIPIFLLSSRIWGGGKEGERRILSIQAPEKKEEKEKNHLAHHNFFFIVHMYAPSQTGFEGKNARSVCVCICDGGERMETLMMMNPYCCARENY